MNVIRRITILTVMLMLTPLAMAATDGPYSDTVALQSTDWNKTLTIPKFNPALGVLISVKVELKGDVTGSMAFENKDAQTQTVTTSLKAICTLKRPDNSTLVITIPDANTVDYNVPAYDGVTDFAGPSGKMYPSLSKSTTEMNTLFAPADLALFTGPGNILLGCTGVGSSTGAGGGNLALQFTTDAGAMATVTYNYEVPEPVTIALMGVGSLLLARRKRRA